MVPGREPYAHHRLPPESEGDGYRMQHALARGHAEVTHAAQGAKHETQVPVRSCLARPDCFTEPLKHQQVYPIHYSGCFGEFG